MKQSPPPDPLILLNVCASIIILFLLIIVLPNKLMMKAAMRRFIMPELQKNGLIFLGYKSTGLWSIGDFKRQDAKYSIILLRGDPRLDIYLYLYFRNKENGLKNHITIRIETVFMIVRKVVYSKPLYDFRQEQTYEVFKTS
jgi:hypothetical protein